MKGFGGDFGFDDEYDETEDSISELKRRRSENRRRVEKGGREERQKRRRKREGKKAFILFLVILLILLLLFALGFYAAKSGVFDFSSDADMKEKFEISGDEAGLFFDGEYLGAKAKKIDGDLCVSLEFARGFDDNFYYDPNELLLLYTDHEKTTEWTTGDGIEYDGEEVYIKLDILTGVLSATMQTYENPERVWIYTEEPKELKVLKNTKFRLEAENNSDVISKLEEGDKVRLLAAGDSWHKVESDGFSGYVKADALEEVGAKKTEENSDVFDIAAAGAETAEAPEAIENKKAEDNGDFPYIHYDGTISLGFHQVMSTQANSGVSGTIAASPGINIIAPTWYTLNGTGINSIASAEYVNEAHAAGVRVWGVVDNFNNPDFSIVDGTDNVLSHTSLRKNLENELIQAAREVGLDGINIDFEQLSGETGDDFAQFIRELSLLTHRENIVLSVDNYVPEAYSEHYRRDVQGEFADYVLIMGYDEYTSEVGPNASIEFVTKGIDKTLEDVPASRVINGIPFYSRIWEEKGGNTTSITVGMDEAKSFVSGHGGSLTWNDGYGCNYAEFSSGGSKYYVWLEDDSSVELKLNVSAGNNLAGVGFWKLGLEDPSVWNVIGRYLAS